jgi:hypothetical protein
MSQDYKIYVELLAGLMGKWQISTFLLWQNPFGGIQAENFRKYIKQNIVHKPNESLCAQDLSYQEFSNSICLMFCFNIFIFFL